MTPQGVPRLSRKGWPFFYRNETHLLPPPLPGEGREGSLARLKSVDTIDYVLNDVLQFISHLFVPVSDNCESLLFQITLPLPVSLFVSVFPVNPAIQFNNEFEFVTVKVNDVISDIIL